MPVAGRKAKQSKSALNKGPSTKANTAAASSGKATSESSDPRATENLCAVCEQKIVEGKDQALFCEGLCQRWFHRYCAGVSVHHFNALSASSDPFHCFGCFQETCATEVKILRETISSLKAEVSTLRDSLGEMGRNCSCSQQMNSASTSDWKCERGGGRGVRGSRGRGGRGGRSMGIRGKGSGGRVWNGEGLVSQGDNVGGFQPVAMRGHAGSQNPQKRRPADRVRVQGV